MSQLNAYMPTPLHWETTHFIAITASQQKFVYCPVGNIISWSEGDYDHQWCHFCKVFFSEKVNNLLGSDEQHMRTI